MDDPWAALVAIVAVSVLLCVIGLIVILFTYARYQKYLVNYRLYESSFDNPDFQEPASYMKEYETQSLNMYVPQDEPVALGEIDMTIGQGNVTAEHRGADPSVAAAVNPVYSESHVKHAGFLESQTIL